MIITNKKYTVQDAFLDWQFEPETAKRIIWEILNEHKTKRWTRRKGDNLSLEEVAQKLGRHRDTVEKYFDGYPGVLEIKHPATKKSELIRASKFHHVSLRSG